MPELYHLGLTVQDIKASYRFYTDVVGLRAQNSGASESVSSSGSEGDGPSDNAIAYVTGDVDYFHVRSEAFDRLTNNAGSEIKYLYLESEDGKLLLQLIEYVAGGTDAAVLGHNRAGSLHMSYFVPDVHAKRAEVTEMGDVKIISDIVEVAAGMFTFYVADPDGIPVEFLEVRK